MLLRVLAGASPGEAVARVVLQVRPPGHVRRLQLVHEIRSRDLAARAIGGKALRGSAGERKVVGQRRVRDRVARGGEAVAAREAVDVRRGRVPDDPGGLFVLHHDDRNVRRPRAAQRLQRADRERASGRHLPARGDHGGGRQQRRRDKCGGEEGPASAAPGVGLPHANSENRLSPFARCASAAVSLPRLLYLPRRLPGPAPPPSSSSLLPGLGVRSITAPTSSTPVKITITMSSASASPTGVLGLHELANISYGTALSTTLWTAQLAYPSATSQL